MLREGYDDLNLSRHLRPLASALASFFHWNNRGNEEWAGLRLRDLVDIFATTCEDEIDHTLDVTADCTIPCENPWTEAVVEVISRLPRNEYSYGDLASDFRLWAQTIPEGDLDAPLYPDDDDVLLLPDAGWIHVRCRERAWSFEHGPEWHTFAVEEDDTVRVWEPEEGIWSTCHVLTEDAQERVLRAAHAGKGARR